jgi:hypothetical protein
MISDDNLETEKEVFKMSWLSKKFKLLKKKIFHVTIPSGFIGIHSSGYIEPNDRTREYSFPQTERSYGLAKGYICLFDFVTPSEDEIISQFFKWEWFFKTHRPFTIVLELEQKLISQYLIRNEEAKKEVGYSKVWIPYVEAWSTQPIPISAIKNYYIVKYSKQKFVKVKDRELLLQKCLNPYGKKVKTEYLEKTE